MKAGFVFPAEAATLRSASPGNDRSEDRLRWHFLYFWPDPHQHISFLPGSPLFRLALCAISIELILADEPATPTPFRDNRQHQNGSSLVDGSNTVQQLDNYVLHSRLAPFGITAAIISVLIEC
jgi:hypothetical protein